MLHTAWRVPGYVCGRLVSHLGSAGAAPNPITSRPKSTSPPQRHALSLSLCLSCFMLGTLVVFAPPLLLSSLSLVWLLYHSPLFSHYIAIAIAFISFSTSPSLPPTRYFHLSSLQLLAISVTQSILLMYTFLFSIFFSSCISPRCLICSNTFTVQMNKCKCSQLFPFLCL